MYSAAEAFPILADAIRNQRRHPDYARVNALRTLYYQLITGAGAKDLLAQFVRREDVDAFEQRVALTQLVTMPWASMIKQQFYRPGRLKNIKRSIGYRKEQQAGAKKLQEIEERVATYWGNQSLEKWMAGPFVDLSFLDPNAFVVTDFKPFNNVTGKAKPYPVVYGSEEAVLFQYTDNILDYLIVKQITFYTDAQGRQQPLERYTQFLGDEILVAMQAPTEAAGVRYDAQNPDDTLPANGGLWLKDQNTQFVITQYRPNAGRVQAVRVGYMPDAETSGRTCVNPMHQAVPYFLKSIHETSEMDLSVALHAHPQKIFYAVPCPGLPKRPCLSGQVENQNDPNGGLGTCTRCRGQGVIVHKSASDALAVPMPEAGSPTPPLKLADYVAYVAPPIDILNFLDTHLRALKQDALDAVFNSELTTSSANATGPAADKTATEISAITDKADNTLAPFCEHRASIWEHSVGLVAELLDNGGPDLQLVFEHPSSLTIKTYAQLVAERKAAVDAGAPYYVIQELDKQLAEMLFSNDETTLAKIKAKTYFTPFLGKSSDEFFALVALNKVRPNDEILWSYGDTIFDELGEEVPSFYSMTRDKQWGYILPKIEKIQAGLPKPVSAVQLPQPAGA